MNDLISLVVALTAVVVSPELDAGMPDEYLKAHLSHRYQSGRNLLATFRSVGKGLASSVPSSMASSSWPLESAYSYSPSRGSYQ